MQLMDVTNFEERFDFALKESDFEQLRLYEQNKGFIERRCYA